MVDMNLVRTLENMHPELCGNIKGAIRAGIPPQKIKRMMGHVKIKSETAQNIIENYIDYAAQ